MIQLKRILLENMTPDVANTIFAKFGVKNASGLDKGTLKNYYIALVKKHHPDIGGNNDDMRYINAAYDVLKTAEPEDKSEPTDLWAGRTTPKRDLNKHALTPRNFEFRMERDESIITYGIGDYFDLIKIMQHLKKLGAEISFDPPQPVNPQTGEWITNKVIVFIGTESMSPEKRNTIPNLTRQLVRKYCSKNKSA